jgi:hypothetical protein
MAHRHVGNPSELDALTTLLGTLKQPFTIEWSQGRDRSLDQNRLQFLWAREASEQRGDMTADEVRCEWKLEHGIPILCEDSEEYREFCRLTLKRLSHEQRLKAMKYTPVTSEMKVRQMVRYLDAIERECAERGITLTNPDADLSAYHDRYREQTRRAA